MGVNNYCQFSFVLDNSYTHWEYSNSWGLASGNVIAQIISSSARLCNLCPLRTYIFEISTYFLVFAFNLMFKFNEIISSGTYKSDANHVWYIFVLFEIKDAKQ